MKKAMWFISMMLVGLVLLSCSGYWTLKTEKGYTVQIPKEVPKEAATWPARGYPIFESQDFSLFGLYSIKPGTDGEVSVLSLIAADPEPKLIGLHYVNKLKGVDKYFVDKSYMAGKPASGRLEEIPEAEVPSTSEIVKIRTGKAPGEVNCGFGSDYRNQFWS